MSSETYYTILGVNPTDSQAVIRKAYLKLSLKYHPDKNPDNPEEAKEQFVKIGEAYEVLSDPTSRAAYDRDQASGGSGSGVGGMNFSSNFQRPEPKSYDTYREAFDAHVGGMSEEELRATMGAAAVIGGIVGSLVGSGLARKVAGNSTVGRVLLETAGSLMGSTVGAEASANLVQNVHAQSRDRITYEERKRVAMERGGPVPEKPKEGWGDLKDSLNETFDNVKRQMNTEDRSAQPVTARGQTFTNLMGAMKNAKKVMEMQQKANNAYR